VTAAEFAGAVSDYVFEEHLLDSEVVAKARVAVERAGLLVVGEPHGVRETPSVLYALAGMLGTRGVAFEWSHEELDAGLQAFVRGAPWDFEELWSLPADAEFFCGDGRITSGHFALLRRLRDEGRLDEAIAFDRLDPVLPVEWQVRDRELAERLQREWRGAPLLVLTGAFHAQLEGETMTAHLVRERPGLTSLTLDYGQPGRPPTPLVLRLPNASPAVVPQRPAA
jgi:hypothetical protein